VNKEKVEGKYDQAKGEAKKEVGEATGDEQTQAEGAWDKVKGGAKEAVGDVKDALKKDR